MNIRRRHVFNVSSNYKLWLYNHDLNMVTHYKKILFSKNQPMYKLYIEELRLLKCVLLVRNMRRGNNNNNKSQQ